VFCEEWGMSKGRKTRKHLVKNEGGGKKRYDGVR